MIYAQTLTHFFAIALSLCTASGVLLHDTNVDKAMVKAVSQQAEAVMSPGNMPHTNSERNSLHQAIRDLNASQPRTKPRGQEDRKYVQAKPSARGHHPFDNYTLPLVR